ncbi:MAG TPA: hypothetical protein VIT23_08485 [Terrimicrobiaceae bacterium]
MRKLGLEGVAGKRIDSINEPGERSGAWIKLRANMDQELRFRLWSPRIRRLAGWHLRGKGPHLRREGEERICAADPGRAVSRSQGVQIAQCPFKNPPEKRASRWGESLTAEKMDQCRWVKSKLACKVAFVEWTDAAHLPH